MGYKSVDTHKLWVAKDSVPPNGFLILNYSVRTKESDHVTENNLVRITRKNIANESPSSRKFRMKIYLIASEVSKRSIPFNFHNEGISGM